MKENQPCIALLKLGENRYLKARPCSERYRITPPTAGYPSFLCNMITTNVVFVGEHHKIQELEGILVETLNSNYFFFLAPYNKVVGLARRFGLPSEITHKESGSVYWGFDNRPLTYL